MIMNKIYIGNLSFKATEQDVEDFFKQFGEIKEIALIRDRYSNELKGFGFITFTDPSSAQNALSKNGEELLGRPLKINLAREEGRREGGGGGRSGGGGGRFGGGRRERDKY